MAYPSDDPSRGEIYWIDLDLTKGSEQSGNRPALIISPDFRNRQLKTVVIAAITTAIHDPLSPVAPVLPAGAPLEKESAVLTFQVRTVDKSRLGGYLGRLTFQQMRAVNTGLALSFGLGS